MPDLDFDFDAPASAGKPTPAFGLLRGHERAVIAAAVALQLTVILSMVVRNVVPTFGSPTVLLRVVPVDPRDLMRGQYVTLSYDINAKHVQAAPGATVYTVLEPEPDGRHYRAGPVLTSPPASGVFIRGTYTGYNRITYGIESYFVQEGRGPEYEEAARRLHLSAEVALSADGTPALRGLVIE